MPCNSGSRRPSRRTIIRGRTTNRRLDMISYASPKMAKKLAKFFRGKSQTAQTARIAMRQSQDVPNFLKRLDQVQKRTARSVLQFD